MAKYTYSDCPGTGLPLLALVAGVLGLAMADHTIVITTRNAAGNQALAGVQVEYSMLGHTLGAVVSGPDGEAVIAPR